MNKKTYLLLFVFMSLSLFTSIVLAESSVPQEDQTQNAPLASPPASANPRYLSGIGTDNEYTIFYEDRADTTDCSYGARIYFVHTTDGAFNLTAPTVTNICDTHFTVKAMPTTIGGTTYAYRAWGSIANNDQHNFYVSNNLITWVRNPISGTSFTFNDPNSTGLHVYYGFHDVIEINSNYMGFAETNTAETVIVWSDEGTNNWDIIAVVGGSNDLPLELGVSPTPTGNFIRMEVNGQEVYGKLSVLGDDSAAYLAINAIAAQASTPALAETAFLDPANWIWSDGSTGLPSISSRVLAEIAQHDIREVWSPPLSNYSADHVIIYTARYNTGSDLGCAASTADCTVVLPVPTPMPTFVPTPIPTSMPAPIALPATGFPHGEVTRVDFGLSAAKYTSTGLELVIPKLGVKIPIVGVPKTDAGWDVTWLNNSAGYLAGSAFPTWAGNTVITGHVWDAYNNPGVFSELKTLKYGDQVQIHAWGLVYTYEVRGSKLVTTQNVSAVLQSEEYDWVTLVTCEFYNPFTGDYLFRRSVRAVLVSVR